jgi:hypothetical protein
MVNAPCHTHNFVQQDRTARLADRLAQTILAVGFPQVEWP